MSEGTRSDETENIRAMERDREAIILAISRQKAGQLTSDDVVDEMSLARLSPLDFMGESK